RGSEMNNWTVKLCRTLVFAVWWLVCAEKATAQDAVWTTYGPYGGIIEALAIDPQTPTTLYAGAPCTGGAADLEGRSGVYKSIDAARTWSRIGNESTDIRVVLAIDPQTPTTLYAGARSGSGLFKSTDGGDSWFALNVSAYSVAIDPQAPNTLYAVTQPGI